MLHTPWRLLLPCPEVSSQSVLSSEQFGTSVNTRFLLLFLPLTDMCLLLDIPTAWNMRSWPKPVYECTYSLSLVPFDNTKVSIFFDSTIFQTNLLVNPWITFVSTVRHIASEIG